MKKVMMIALALALVLMLAAGCSGNGNGADSGAKKGIDALPAGTADEDGVFGNLRVATDLTSLLDDEGFAGRSAEEAIIAPVNENWVSTADLVG